MSTAMLRRPPGCMSDLTIDRWLLGELPASGEGRRLEEHLRHCPQCGSRVRSLKGLYTHQRSAHRGARVAPRVVPPPTSTFDQHGVAQVIILRDGLLVGTEVFTAGEWIIGSDPRADLTLVDASVQARHARLTFRGGKAGIEDLGGGLFVNGFRVPRAELRPIDEVTCGPYQLRTRVIAERWNEPDQPQVTVLHPLAPLGLAEQVTAPGGPQSQPELPASPVTVASLRVRAAAPVVPPAAVSPAPPVSLAPRRLELRLFWGEACQAARIFGLGEVVAGDGDGAAMPLWGFGLEETDFVLAEGRAEGYQLFVPAGVGVERRGSRGWELVVPTEAAGGRRCVLVEPSAQVRLRHGPMSLYASIAAAAEPVAARRLTTEGWQVPALSSLLFVGLLALVHFNTVDEPDFTAHELPKPFIRSVFEPKAPPPPPVKDPVATAQTAGAEPTPHPPRRPPRPHRPPKEDPLGSIGAALATFRGNSLDKISASLDRVGAKGPRVASSGHGVALPGQGLGAQVFGFSRDGAGIGREGAKNAGQFDTRGLGKGRVAARVDRVSGDRVRGSGGNIDRNQVAAVINSHLGEVQRCYERALLHEAKMQGRATLEWVISTTGDVRRARSKSSTMPSPAVENCVLDLLKRWQFPKAAGGEVTVSYPFVFDSVAF